MSQENVPVKIVTTHKMSYSYLNRKGELYGGQMLSWADEIATIAAERFVQGPISTVLLDQFTFHSPVLLEDIVTMEAVITYVGHSSMEVAVEAYAQCVGQPLRRAAGGFVVMVAVDETGHPVPAPSFLPRTDEELALWAAGQARSEARKKNRAK